MARKTIIDWLRDRGVTTEVLFENDPWFAPGTVVYTVDSPSGWGRLKITLVNGKLVEAWDETYEKGVTTEASVKRWFTG